MEKLTQKREYIYSIIKNNKAPISALGIYNKIENTIDLSTIYRFLSFLEEKDYILKTNIKNTKYYYIKNKEHTHFIFCTKCDNVEQIPCEIKDNTTYEILEHDFVALGICPECKNKKR